MGNKGCFPALSKLSWSLVCMPATSRPAEQVFSAAGNICSQKRGNLTQDHLEMLTFISVNKL